MQHPKRIMCPCNCGREITPLVEILENGEAVVTPISPEALKKFSAELVSSPHLKIASPLCTSGHITSLSV